MSTFARPDEEIFELETAIAHIIACERELEEVIERAWDSQRRHVVPSGMLLADALDARQELYAAHDLLRRIRARGTRFEHSMKASRAL